MKRTGWLRIAAIAGCFTLSLGLIGYPFLANYLFEHRTATVADQVEQTGEDLTDARREEELSRAQEYNQTLASGHVVLTDPFKQIQEQMVMEPYDTLLDLSGDGSMGTVEIPKISVTLPIYHGTSEEVLEKGAGHLAGSSLPVGGTSTHSVLTGHTGLSSARLFTDLTELEVGDVFFLHVLGETLPYEVDQVKVVLPENLSDLSIIPGEDHCTLLTCTPYGVNTHRLLVRGERVPYNGEEEVAVTPAESMVRAVQNYYMLYLVLGLSVTLLIILILRCLIRPKRRKKSDGGQADSGKR